MIEFPIKNKFSNEVQFTAKINCDESTSYSQKVGLAVKWAIENNICNLSNANLKCAYLQGANLMDADLIDADLTDVNLMDANLYCANLEGTNLMDANLYGANLTATNLKGAYLQGANLMDADLIDADLTDANLYDANLMDANLYGANLTGTNLMDANLKGANLRATNLKGANLKGANLRFVDLTSANLKCELSEEQLRNYKHDFWGILLQYRNEVESLREHILAGKINGSMYSGECACLMGTIANIKGCKVDELKKDHHSYIESWFTMIKEGDTPENNYASEMTLKWLDEFVSLTK